MAVDSPRVAGFRFSGIHCGIKADEKLDLGLIATEEPVVAAAVFTKNRVKAAPVLVGEERIERGRVQAVLVNSGNANACTGEDGLRAVRDTCGAVAEELDVDMGYVFPASTGVIGVPLPVDRIESAVVRLVAELSEDHAQRFAESIMTTDRWVKVSQVNFEVEGHQPATVLGIAKGAGMIHPNMATTLCFLMTDAPMSSSFLRTTLRLAVDNTFNAITVDGDTSTNDTVLALSSGKVNVEPLRGSDRDAKNFGAAMNQVLHELSHSIVKDGEGAKHVVTLEVYGAPSEAAARQVARHVSNSLLVKTAVHGCSPNWGRLVMAAGTAGVMFDPAKLEIRFDDVVVVRKGVAVGGSSEELAREVMGQAEYHVGIGIGSGPAKSSCIFCDIGDTYVDINSSYVS